VIVGLFSAFLNIGLSKENETQVFVSPRGHQVAHYQVNVSLGYVIQNFHLHTDISKNTDLTGYTTRKLEIVHIF
jgi:hypothetical protein